ncbi:MAG: HNH endonuclease, partial [candidate division Zixibacteria bacterium]|nr:HNH endonuclease [candidate division Zixibacteria bacterium]
MRARILERNGFTCAMCGMTPLDEDPYRPGRNIRLHVDHINPDGPSSEDNLRTLCNNCNEGRSNLAVPPALNTLSVLRQIRKLPRDEQKRIFEDLKKRFNKK